VIEGRCMCGRVRYRTEAAMRFAVHCHCEDCQRAASADYASWFGVPADAVTWEGERSFYASSPGVRRSFCPTCGTPLTYEADKFPGDVHLYGPTLLDRSLFRPQAHIFWSEHVPWLGGEENLPRLPKGGG